MAKKTPIKSVRDLLKKVGREDFLTALGHSTQVVTRAVAENKMPAHWYVGVRALCEQKGVEVSEDLFRWSRKPPSPTQNANAQKKVQGRKADVAAEARS